MNFQQENEDILNRPSIIYFLHHALSRSISLFFSAANAYTLLSVVVCLCLFFFRLVHRKRRKKKRMEALCLFVCVCV